MPILPGATLGRYQSEQEIAAVVRGFESCTTGVDDFSHSDHLTAAVRYLRGSTPEQAFQKMSAGLLRFLDHHGVGRTKYDERLTMKWITLVQDAINEMVPDLSLLEVTNIVVERFADYRTAGDSLE